MNEYWPNILLLLCLSGNSTGGKASTPPDSDDDSIQHELDDDQPRDANDDPQFHDNDPIVPQNVVYDQPCPQTRTRQKGMAAVMKVNPPDMIAKLTAGLKKTTLRIVEDIRSHYAVSAEEQPDGILSDELNYGLVWNKQQLPSQDQSMKYTRFQPDITFQRQQRMNCFSWSAMWAFFSGSL